MTRQNSPQTLSKLNSATNVSPLAHESSPKNDVSLFRGQFVAQRKGANEAQEWGEVVTQRLVLKNRLDALRRFSKGGHAKQLSDVESLKKSALFDSVKSVCFSERSQTYTLSELYDLLIALNDKTCLDEWFIRFGHKEVIVHAQFESVFPGLRFLKDASGAYRCTGFNFDIRFTTGG